MTHTLPRDPRVARVGGYSNSATSCGPTQATDASTEMPRATSATRSSVSRSSTAIGRVRIDVLAEHDGLRGRVARDGVRVLEREHPPAGGVRAGALELLLARAVLAQVVDDPAHAVVGLDALADSRPADSCRIGTSAKEWSTE